MFTGMFQPAVVTFTGSLAAAGWRMAITPIDTVKTIMQVDGEPGLERLKERVAEHGMGILYNGAFGTAVVAVVSHFPWFYTNNFLERRWPPTRGITSTTGLCVCFICRPIFFFLGGAWGGRRLPLRCCRPPRCSPFFMCCLILLCFLSRTCHIVCPDEHSDES